MRKNISTEMQDRIISRLESQDVNQPCPRCGNENFILSDSYVVLPVQGNINDLTFGGKSIPCAVTICSKCGFVSMHAIGTLGLMNEAKNNEEN